jgi:hypothetical protein
VGELVVGHARQQVDRLVRCGVIGGAVERAGLAADREVVNVCGSLS